MQEGCSCPWRRWSPSPREVAFGPQRHDSAVFDSHCRPIPAAARQAQTLRDGYAEIPSRRPASDELMSEWRFGWSPRTSPAWRSSISRLAGTFGTSILGHPS